MGYSPAQKGAIDLAKRSLVDSIYTSCKVEGLSTTFPDTQNILDYPINLMYIRELNKICGNRLIYGSGELRTSNVRIGGSSYIPQIPTQEEVIRKLNELNTMTDPIERAVKTFCYLAKAQLFIDGNKILISEGIGILQINDAVQDIISELPFSVRSQYQTDKECAMDFIEAYLAGKQC